MHCPGNASFATQTLPGPPAQRTFHGYARLPEELQEMIAQQACNSIRVPGATPHLDLAPFACVDAAWQRVVESQTLRDLRLPWEQLGTFALIYNGMRRRLALRSICLVVDTSVLFDHEWVCDDQGRRDMARTVARLFVIFFTVLKRWDASGRADEALITFSWDIRHPDGDVVAPGPPGAATTCLSCPFDSCSMPMVPVIGQVRRQLTSECKIDFRSSVSLVAKFPRVHRLDLDMTADIHDEASIRDDRGEFTRHYTAEI